ncbi:hypothetical protein [Streptomyces sp. NPDC059262]|uniref:hypothetical protein n=1 Tax=Streptomyces sp. NPDC059262 TaxID=3346797 RepID=UPI0036BCC830
MSIAGWADALAASRGGADDSRAGAWAGPPDRYAALEVASYLNVGRPWGNSLTCSGRYVTAGSTPVAGSTRVLLESLLQLDSL